MDQARRRQDWATVMAGHMIEMIRPGASIRWRMKHIDAIRNALLEGLDEYLKAAGPETGFKVTLDSIGTSKINVLKVIRAATGCGIKDAKDLVESESPTITSLTEEKANALKHAIEQAGGTASVGID